MANLSFLLTCIVLGWLLRQVTALRQREAHLVINNVLLYVCLPAATLLYTSSTVFERQYIVPILMPWGLFIVAWVSFRSLRHYLKFHLHTEAVLILTAGIPSVSFVGFPIFEMLYGEEGMHIGILMSQAGSFLVCSTLGIWIAASYAHDNPKKRDWKSVAQNVFKFPPFIAFCIALTVNLLAISLPSMVVELLRKLAAPFSFLALISIGMQIDFHDRQMNWHALRWGLGYKLLIAPLLVILFLTSTQQKSEVAMISALGAGLGPMNTVAIIATNFGLNPKLAAQMVGVGIPLSLLTVSILYWLLVAVGCF